MTGEIKHPCPTCNGSGETGKPHEPAHVHPRYCAGCCPSCLGQKRASVSVVGAQARAERAEAARDAFEGRAKVAELQSETHARIATSLQDRIRDMHTKVCGDDDGMGSPAEHCAAILAAFDSLRAELDTRTKTEERLRSEIYELDAVGNKSAKAFDKMSNRVALAERREHSANERAAALGQANTRFAVANQQMVDRIESLRAELDEVQAKVARMREAIDYARCTVDYANARGGLGHAVHEMLRDVIARLDAARNNQGTNQ